MALTDDAAQALARRTATLVAMIARAQFAKFLELLAAGADVPDAITQAQAGFSGAFAERLAESFTELMQRMVGVAEVRAMPVSGVPLSRHLYRNERDTAMQVEALIRQHAAGLQQARELSMRLYDGYNPQDGIRRPLEGSARAELPAALRSLTEDFSARRELTVVQVRGQESAARLKTGALRAAYTEAIDAWAAGAGEDAVRRKLSVAVREKNRYFANRIAQTELARAHQAQKAAEFMADDTIEVVKVVINPMHPKRDICDLHARADLYGLGPGCYPKALAPRPPFHPHCWCKLSSRPSLTGTPWRQVPGGEAAYLRGLPLAEAAQVMGSQARAEAVLNGASVAGVLDAGKDPAYRLVRLGDGAGHPLVKNEGVIEPAAFKRFFNNEPGSPDRLRVAALSDADRALLKTTAADLWLSRVSLGEHRLRHPEVTADDYLRIPEIVRDGQVWAGHKDRRYLLLMVAGKPYRAAIKIDESGAEAWFLSLVISGKQKPPKGAVRVR